jgi:hypothetical protein
MPDDALIDVSGIGRFPKTANAEAFAMNIQEIDGRILTVLSGPNKMIALGEDRVPHLHRYYRTDCDDLHGKMCEIWHVYAILGRIHTYPNISMSLVLDLVGFCLINPQPTIKH